jgi:hypothetical protein
MRYGLDALLDLNSLPLLYRDAKVHYEGSIDKKGGNADWDWWLYQDERGEWVIHEAYGPGCIYNIVQHRYLSSTDPLFRFYFDGEKEPRFELHASEFGYKYPFIEPLAGRYIGPVDSGRGPIRVIRSFVPMLFEHSVRITTDVRLKGFERVKGDGGWGHVIWHSFSENPGFKSFDGTEDYRHVLEMYRSVGADPKPKVPGETHRVFDTVVGTGKKLTLVDVSAAGSVQSIRLKIRDILPQHLLDLWIGMSWDGHEKCDVCSPVGAFFGNELGVHPTFYLMLGMDTEGSMYNYYPMPYWSGAKIWLENRGKEPVVLDFAMIELASENPFRREDCGYFRTSEYYQRTHTEGADSMIAKIQGRGHVVGSVITAHGERSGLVTCEGDVRVHIDGILTPQVESDGSESYACYGWGFPTPPECNPISGYDGYPDSPWSMVRTLPGDCYPFRSRLDFGIESGGCNDQYLEHSGIVFHYGRDEESVVETDRIDFDDELCCKAHALSGMALSIEKLTAFYEGDDDDVEVSGSVAVYKDTLEFNCAIDEKNNGVRLRRRSDQLRGRQAARVYVDGVLVEERIWCAPDRNQYKRWLDDEFEIAARYTKGRNQVRIRIEPVCQGEELTWNQSLYRVYSHL